MSTKKSLKIIKNTTCFVEHQKLKLTCSKSSCRHWFENKESYNCIILASKGGMLKQEKVGELLGLTRMRVCQIEKSVMKKIKEFIKT